MPDLTFATKGAAEVIAAQEKLNQAAKSGAEAYDDLEKSAKDAGREVEKTSKQGMQSQEKLTKEVKKTREEYRKNLEEQRRLGRIAEQITKRNETAQERYNRLLKDAQAATKNVANGAQLYNREVAALNKEMQASTGRFRSFAGQQEQTFGKNALAAVARYAAAVASIGTAVQVVTNELRAQQELVDSAARSKATVSQSRNILIRNLPGSSQKEINSVLGQNANLAKRLGISESIVNVARADALSATGGDIQASLSAVGIASQFLKDQPAAIAGFTGSLTDVAKVTGTNDALTNLGYISTLGGLSRVVDPRAQSDNLVPAVIGQLSFGSTAQEAGALVAALTSAGADRQGASTGTASIALAEQLRGFFGNDGQTTGGRIRALQADQSLAKQFLDKASFEKKSKGPIEQLLLNPNSEAAKAFAQNLTRFTGNAGLRRTGSQSIANLGLNALNRTADRERGLAAFDEQQGIASPDTLNTQEIQYIKNQLLRAGGDALSNSLGFAVRSPGGVSVEEAVGLINVRRNNLQQLISSQEAQLSDSISFGKEDDARRREQLNTDKESLKKLDDLIEAVRQTNRQLEDAGLVGVPG